MKKSKKEKGITLVALIITIVVLLILAMVAIGAVQDSKIIGHSQNAAGSYNQAKANEIGYLTGYEETINKYVPGDTQVTGAAYGVEDEFLIITSDNRVIIIDGNRRIERGFTYVDELNVINKGDIVFSKFLSVTDIGKIAVSDVERKIYILVTSNTNEDSYTIEDIRALMESKDISEYLK